MLDLTKPVQTKSGYPVTIVRTDLRADFPILAIAHYEFYDLPVQYTKEGRYNIYIVTDRDLINVYEKPKEKKKIEFWVNVYPFNNTAYYACVTRQKADECANPERTECLHFVREYTEGDLDE